MTPELKVLDGDRRRAVNQVFRSRIQRLRMVEFHCSENGLCDQAAMTRTVIDEMVLEHRRADPMAEAFNSGDGVYRP